MKKNRKITWSYLELSGLLEDEESHVHFTRITKHLALHPYYLNNIQQGLNQILRSSLNTYDRELKGFVLAFRNPKLLSNVGEMLYDSPFIHIDIEADFYLFRPTVGSFLKGVVNKKGLDHIIMLVHKTYTVSIPKPDDTEEWPGDSVEIGQEVKCCVSQIDNKSRPPFICGTLRSDYSQGCRLPDSINNIDNVNSAIESANSTMRTDTSVNGISEDDGVSEKERKKHRKKHKRSHEDSSEIVCKVENESESNDTSRIIKSEKNNQSTQDTILSTSLNDSEVDDIPKKHKKNKKASKSLPSDDTILDERAESRKAVKRESSVPLDSITETEAKKRKKHAKKSKESVLTKTENEEEIVNTENTVPRIIKSEDGEPHTYKKRVASSADLSSNNLEDSVSKKRKKNKKPMIMSDSESEGHVAKVKIEKPDSFIDRITNERSKDQASCSQTKDSNDTFEMPRFLKKEVHDASEKERKKSSKKQTSRKSNSVKIKNEDAISDVSNASDNERKKTPKKDSQLKSVKVKNELDVIYDANNASDNERKKSPKKHASRDSQLKSVKVKNEVDIIGDFSNASDKERKRSLKKHARDSDSETRIKSENTTNDINDISRVIKRESEESQCIKPAMDNNSSNSDLDRASKKPKKKKRKTSDSESECPVKVKSEKV
ncbi:PREDICTED: probable DNA-directed RNA polymerase I subunit RPA43 [Wasmannia auropunctata]|uniref:probable DNA-directed RNA polymerase I subunit RPA43 n=1 Tax=Wasmannia auropunctata TaxID=64793 RepID=UPI0005EF5D88|nr:PREDICTED: probable DNA-directed RNA polymerase I subunit RPA43 [Wasmannia auropunctata]